MKRYILAIAIIAIPALGIFKKSAKALAPNKRMQNPKTPKTNKITLDTLKILSASL